MRGRRGCFVVALAPLAFVLGAEGCRASTPPAAAPPPAKTTSAPPDEGCRSIPTDPEWTAIEALAGKKLTDDAALCAQRRDCCEVAEHQASTPPSRRTVVKLALEPHDDVGACPEPGTFHSMIEYWLVERAADGNVASLRLLVASHFAPYAPEHGKLESPETFVWTLEETCYGAGPSCAPTTRARRIDLSPSPHVVGDGERMCAGARPLMVSADW